MLPHDKYVMPKHIIKYLFVAFFIMFFSTIIITPLYFALNYDLLPKAPIYRLVLGGGNYTTPNYEKQSALLRRLSSDYAVALPRAPTSPKEQNGMLRNRA